MRAMVYTNYGSPEVFQLREMEKPNPKEKEIVVKIHATQVGYGDVIARNFKKISPRQFNMPFLFWIFAKICFGVRNPKIAILGSQFAGEIEAIGSKVQSFRPGDQVFGYLGQSMGAYAEYVCMAEDGIVTIKPANMTYAEASAVPYGALVALNLLRKANVQRGQKVLINGASGGIGSAAVQLAKFHFGAEVTGVCSTLGLQLVKSIGADKVIDYTKEDFTLNGEVYDLIVDILGKSTFSYCKNSLKKDGRYLLASFKVKELIQMLWTKVAGKKKVICALALEKSEDLILIKELIEAGKIKSVIDRSYTLEQMSEAHTYVESGHKKGSVVITVGGNNKA
ncbi:L-threonine 3-dehydrogenase [Paenibacillus plantiphilus]|uniref:L-threonine 3-dehydrogenase n=1 Tax=Paenibacillus plantiphilus TaxID=2905650 RepID=A0ABN8GBW7_9BACL|nr:NAD(P)-dependent alcohol dehydrogenase [Paenibacillus plantiphilus]CAH1200663.1 L-threonine 3-dehydrogenase [Paenibacillus plantiphilus]